MAGWQEAPHTIHEQGTMSQGSLVIGQALKIDL